jgi:hypothetical protein
MPHIENTANHHRFLHDAAIQREQGGGGLFWQLVSGIASRPARQMALPCIYAEIEIEMLFEAMRRREKRLQELNAPAGKSGRGRATGRGSGR